MSSPFYAAKRLTLVLVLGCAASGASAQDFLSPKPMVPPPAAKPAAKTAPAPKTTQQKPVTQSPSAQASPAQTAAGAQGAKPDIAEDVGDWRLRCFSKPNRACQMSQRRVNTSNQSLLIWVELTRAIQPKPITQMAVMLPLGVRIAPRLPIRADDQPLIEVPIVTCVPTGCVHSAELPETGLNVLQKSQSVSSEMIDMKGQKIPLPISMRGFNEAYLKTATFLKAAN